LKNIFDNNPIDIKKPMKKFKKLIRKMWEIWKKFGLLFIPEKEPVDRLRRLRLRWDKLHGEASDG
jgi:hypothetical protein